MRHSSNDIFRPRRRRRIGRWLLLGALIPLVALGATAYRLQKNAPVLTGTGVGSSLKFKPISDLPDWARDVVHDQQFGSDHHFVALAVDLNRDEQLEILLAPAPPRQDLFIPESPLRVLLFAEDRWQQDETDLSCRPAEIGSFLTNDWWDLRCRTAHGPQLLRWNGFGYSKEG